MIKFFACLVNVRKLNIIVIVNLFVQKFMYLKLCVYNFTVVATFIATLSLYIGTLRAAQFIHNSLLKRILRAPLEWFDLTPVGRVVNRFSKDIEATDSDIPATLRAFCSCLFSVNSQNFYVWWWKKGEGWSIRTIVSLNVKWHERY